MTPISKHRILRSDEVIGHLLPTPFGWCYEVLGAAPSERVYFSTEDEAEVALREEVHQSIGQRLLFVFVIIALASHPLLYIVSAIR